MSRPKHALKLWIMQLRGHEWVCASEIKAAERGSRSRGYAWIEIGLTANAISDPSCFELTREAMNWNEATLVGELSQTGASARNARRTTLNIEHTVTTVREYQALATGA